VTVKAGAVATMSGTEIPTNPLAERFRIALIQVKCVEDVEINRKNTEVKIRSAAQHGAKIVCLQELFSTEYFCQTQDISTFDLAEDSSEGVSVQHCKALAKELAVVILVPVFEKRAAGVYYNTVVVVDTTGERLGCYRKIHIPDDTHFLEKFYFSPGDLGYQVFDTSIAKVGVLICWDQWFPEAARLTAMAGAEVIFYPTAIGWLREEASKKRQAQLEAWKIMHQSHAVANGIYVAAANRVGREGEIDFWGHSFVADPSGQIISKGSGLREDIVVADCDRREIEIQRREWPFLRDRRIDSYSALATEFWLKK
tara:strand:+ start:8132 stop:9067 length:936 start_codon:yes stop_codon:yes gene_type:complete